MESHGRAKEIPRESHEFPRSQIEVLQKSQDGIIGARKSHGNAIENPREVHEHPAEVWRGYNNFMEPPWNFNGVPRWDIVFLCDSNWSYGVYCVLMGLPCSHGTPIELLITLPKDYLESFCWTYICGRFIELSWGYHGT